MDVITADTMAALLEPGPGPRVSIYLPTHRAGAEKAQDPIRLRRLLGDARAELVETGARPSDADTLLGSAKALEHDATFWEGQGDGLAVFAAPDGTRHFRLPGPVDELVAVTDGFHVKPLWPLLAGSGAFHVLALSRHRVRLLWADRYSVEPVELPEEVPAAIDEVMRFSDPEPQLQNRPVSRTGRGRVVASFHGHGSGAERQDRARTEAFLRAVDRGVRSLVDPRTPVLLAGVDELVATYRSVSRLGRLMDTHISGNADELGDADLHRKGLGITEPIARQRVAADVEAFASAGTKAATDLGQVVAAATAGRVATLFLPSRVQVWGTFDDGNAEIHHEREPGDRDLLDLAGSAVWSMGGRLHVVEPDTVPGPGEVAAVLRY